MIIGPMMSLNAWILLSSATGSFTLMLASFVFQMAAAAPGITSRCRSNSNGKTSTLLVSPSPECENASKELPIDLPSGLIVQISVTCLLLNPRLAREVETP